MARNFYFANEAELVAGSAAFAARVSADYGAYGLSSEQAATFAGLDAALQSAYALASQPATRTVVTVASKNAAIRAMRSYAILLTKIIDAAGVNDAQRIELGLRPRATRTARRVPEQPPVIRVVSVSGRLVRIRLREAGSERRGLPFGAAGANLYSHIGEAPPADASAYRFERLTTRATTELLFPISAPSGATVWLSACWVSGRGETSVASTPISFTLQGGAIPAAA